MNTVDSASAPPAPPKVGASREAQSRRPGARLLALVRREPALTAVLAALYVAALVPIWWPRFLPLLDQPNHLAHIAIWRRLADPSWHYSDFYRSSPLPVPYWGYYFPCYLLAHILPVEAAAKLYLSIYAAALPASVIALGRRFGRSPWLGVLAFPLVFNYSFGYGFISYCVALPTALFALALLDKYLAEGGLLRLAGVVALTVATFFGHVLPWLLLGVSCLPVLLAHWRQWRRVLLAAAALLSTAVGALFDLRLASAEKALVGSTAFHLSDWRFQRAYDAMDLAPHRLLTAWPGDGDELCLLGLVLSFVLLAATAARAATEQGGKRTLRDWIPELCFLIAAFAYLEAPYKTYKPLDWWNINPRIATMAALFGALLVRGPIGGRRRLLLVPAVIAAVAYPLLLNRQFVDFNGRAAGMARLMEKVPRGSSTLTLLLGDNSDPALDPEVVPFTQFHSYPQLLAGGYDPYQFKLHFPFKETKALPAPGWTRFGEFNQAAHGSFYDFVLTRNEPRDFQLFGAYANRVKLVGHDGAWRLYATKDIR